MFERSNQLLINFTALIPEFENEINMKTFIKKKKKMLTNIHRHSLIGKSEKISRKFMH